MLWRVHAACSKNTHRPLSLSLQSSGCSLDRLRALGAQAPAFCDLRPGSLAKGQRGGRAGARNSGVGLPGAEGPLRNSFRGPCARTARSQALIGFRYFGASARLLCPLRGVPSPLQLNRRSWVLRKWRKPARSLLPCQQARAIAERAHARHPRQRCVLKLLQCPLAPQPALDALCLSAGVKDSCRVRGRVTIALARALGLNGAWYSRRPPPPPPGCAGPGPLLPEQSRRAAGTLGAGSASA